MVARAALRTMKTLLALFPAPGTPPGRLALLRERLRREPGLGAATQLYLAPDASLVGPRTPESVAGELAAAVHAAWLERGGYDDVLLLAEGVGGLLLRRAWLRALAAGFPWAERASRFVFVETPHRGIDTRWYTPLAPLFDLVPDARPFLHDLQRATPFLVDLELAWTNRLRELGPRSPTLVHVRGRDDRRTTLDEAAVIATAPRGRVLTLPGDRDLLHLRKAADPYARGALFADLLVGDEPPGDRPGPREEAERVVFLLPGGRVRGGRWVDELCERLQRHGGRVRVVVPWRARSSLWLAVPFLRLVHFRRLLARLAAARARRPDAEISVLAHGVGAFLFLRALDACPELRVERLVLAGGLYPAALEPRALAGRVDHCVEVCAARDLVSALWGGFLSGLLLGDVGPSGLRGGRCGERAYLDGGHTAALEERELARLAPFLAGECDELRAPEHLLPEELPRWPPALAEWTRRLALPLLALAALALF